MLIDHIDDPGDLPHLGIGELASRNKPAIVGIRCKALATRTCSRATPGVIEQHQDSQCANDLKSLQYRIAFIASNSPSNANNVH
jgi:hypothetical protein